MPRHHLAGSVPSTFRKQLSPLLVYHVLELKGHSAASAKPLKEIASQTEIRLPHDNGFCQLEQSKDCCEDCDGNYSQF